MSSAKQRAERGGDRGIALVPAIVVKSRKALFSGGRPWTRLHTEAVTAGFFESKTWGRKYPKIQLLTIAELLTGKKIDMPPIKQVGATFKKAGKFIKEQNEQYTLKIDET